MMKIDLVERIEKSKAALDSIRDSCQEIADATDLICTSLRSGGRIFACGNGGSAAEAMHFTTELCGRYRSNRNPFPAFSLTSDGTAITCIGNDFGWENIFARQLIAHAKPGDVVLIISTSGNSPNILTTLSASKEIGVSSIGLLGKGGGKAKDLCDFAIVIGSDDTGAIQEAHLAAIHIMCESLEPHSDVI